MRRLLLLIILSLGFLFPSHATFAAGEPSLIPTMEYKLDASTLSAGIQKQLPNQQASGIVEITTCKTLHTLRVNLRAQLHGYYLASKIRCGSMMLGDIPYYITHILQFLIWLAGSISVIMVMYGGYQYAIGGLTDNKEDGKKTITSAVIGLIVVLLAWVIVSLIQALVLKDLTGATPAAAPVAQMLYGIDSPIS